MTTPGDNYKRWHSQGMPQLFGIKPIPHPSSVLLTFFPETKRKSDLTNKAESIMDLLVDAKIIEDDNWFVIPHISLLFGTVDKKNPRVEVIFY